MGCTVINPFWINSAKANILLFFRIAFKDKMYSNVISSSSFLDCGVCLKIGLHCIGTGPHEFRNEMTIKDPTSFLQLNGVIFAMTMNKTVDASYPGLLFVEMELES